ncbi:MAG: acyl-CoA dehydrogenase family protein [Acidobacteria bacterium]|nr:acyl-CoA dehydrogenase family protein [Acidobacteriota bacterium]MCI0663220.1 acyl-CoA dehydrogenase family protein [Acidobacteriota bacterium]
MSSADTDFFKLDALLSDEEKLARDSIRTFVQDRVNPIIADCFEEGRFPKELIPEMAKLGLLGSTLPEKYGGAGVNGVSYGLICQELEAGDSGIRSFVSVQSSLCMYPIYQFGSEEQRQKYLPKMATGEIIGCFGLTEPNSGSDPGSMRTRAIRTRDGWLLNGSKAWITNGTIADLAVVWAKTDDNDTIRGFIVEKGTKGFTAADVKHKMSLRASVTSELFFQDCLIPEENVLPSSKGLKSPLMCLSQARYGIAWGAVGAAISCYQTAVDYAKQRVQFNRPIAGFQLTQEKLVKMFTEICKAQLLCLRLGRMKDAGELEPVHVSMGKMNNVAMARECAQVARSILGGNGIVGEYPIMRHMCNLESVYTYEGTNEVHLLVLGKHITGLDAFSN